MSVIIRFNGLCVISVPAAGAAKAFFPLNKQHARHKAVLMTRASSLVRDDKQQTWNPTGVGLDFKGRQICYWELEGKERLLAFKPDDVEPKDPSQWGTDHTLNLNFDEKHNPVISVEDDLEGGRLTLPKGDFQGSGKEEQFNLVNEQDPAEIIQPGFFYGTIEWHSKQSPKLWRLVCEGSGKYLTFKNSDDSHDADEDDTIILSISNTVPEFGSDVLHHFAGVYEVVRVKTKPQETPKKRYTLVRAKKSPAVISEEGVNCIPGGGTS
jgi:hypothetical protein